MLGGLYALLGAVSLAELGAMIPKSGGQYVFARYALGEYAGFLVGWSDWISTCGSAAGVSLLIGEFSGALIPALNGKREAVMVAVAVASVFAVLQWRGVVWGSTSQNITSLLKAVAFVVLIAAAFMLGGNSSASTASPAIPTGLALTSRAGFVTPVSNLHV